MPEPRRPPCPAEAPAETIVAIGGMELSPTLYGIFVEETRSHLAQARMPGARELAEGVAVNEEFERSAHTLAGISGTVKFDAMREVAHGLEGLLERLQGRERTPASER